MKFTRIILFMAAVALLASCGGKKTAEPTEELNGMPAMQTVGEDSVAVRQLVRDFMDQIVAGEYDMAMNMIKDTFRTDSLTGKPLELPADVREDYLNTFKEFNVTDYSIRRITFSDYDDNEVQCEVILDGAVPMNYYFKPIKCTGEWYLGIRDTNRGDRPMNID